MTNFSAKKKGPLRIEAIVPVIFLIVATILYSRFFLDFHMRKSGEAIASYIHGAEVNIGDLKTDFLAGTLKVYDIQVTDKKDPKKNLFSLEDLSFAFSWDALLRLKFVITEATTLGINIGGDRETAGIILKKEDSSAGDLKKAGQVITDEAKEQVEGNVFGDIAKVLEGTQAKDQIEDIRMDLQSEKRIDSLQIELENKEKEWNQALAKLQQKEDLKRVQAKAKSIKIDKKKPWKSLKEVKVVTKEIKAIIKDYKQKGNSLKNDLKYFANAPKEIEELIQKDLQSLKQRASIPNLDTQSIAEALIAKMFKVKVAEIRKYVALARKYMPADNADKKEIGKAERPKRGEGLNISFPITSGYPFFWLQKMVISSKGMKDVEFSGTLENVTNDPIFLQKPATFDLEGNFQAFKVKAAKVQAVFDHTKAPATESFSVDLQGLVVENMMFGQSSHQIGLKKAIATSNIKGQIVGETIKISSFNQFHQPQYYVESKSEKFKSLMTDVLSDIPLINIEAKAQGSLSQIKWSFSSNLGDEISRGVHAQVKKKIKAKEKEIKDKVNKRIAGKKEKFEKQYQKVSSKIKQALAKNEKEIDKAKSNATKELTGKQKNAKSGPAKKLEKKAKKLLKKLF